MAARAKFIVLTGVHNGASAPIGNVVTLVGSGGDCDVVLSDKGIAALHASVSLGGERPVVRQHERPADAASSESGDGDMQTDWYTPFALGPVWVCVVPAGFEWGASVAWSAPEVDEVAPAAAPQQTPLPSPPTPGGRGRAGRVALVVGLLALVIGELVALKPSLGRLASTDTAQTGLSPAAREHQDAAARLTQLVNAANLSDVSVQAGSERIALVGFVDTDEQLTRLNSEVKSVAPQGLLMQVKAGSELARRAQQFLADPGIEARYEGAGRIRLAGRSQRIKAETSLPAKLAQLRVDLGPSISLTDEIDHGADAQAAKAVEHRMPIRIAEVQADEPAHFRTVDGARYFEGARLPDGAEVVRIGAREILFRRAGRDISYVVAE